VLEKVFKDFENFTYVQRSAAKEKFVAACSASLQEINAFPDSDADNESDVDQRQQQSILIENAPTDMLGQSDVNVTLVRYYSLGLALTLPFGSIMPPSEREIQLAQKWMQEWHKKTFKKRPRNVVEQAVVEPVVVETSIEDDEPPVVHQGSQSDEFSFDLLPRDEPEVNVHNTPRSSTTAATGRKRRNNALESTGMKKAVHARGQNLRMQRTGGGGDASSSTPTLAGASSAFASTSSTNAMPQTVSNRSIGT